jgi:hypothetical protein
LLDTARMTAIWTLLEHLALAARLTGAVPALDPELAAAHVAAAHAAATDEIRPELLLAMAYVESRYSPYALSRMVDGERRTGNWTPSRPPPFDRGTSLFCGPLQTRALSWKQCLSHRDLTVAYHTSVRELTVWLRDRRVRGNIAKALAGYGCGNHGVTTGRCNRYPERVLRRARAYADAASLPPSPRPAPRLPAS